MSLSSSKLTAAFVGVFLLGVAVGALLLISFSDMRLNRFFTSTGDPKSMEARIDAKYVKDYGLTPDEMAKISPLTAQMTQQLYRTRHQFGVDIIATLDDYHAKIGAQMTPEHRAIFEKANLERKKWMTQVLLPDQAAAGQN